jgi:LPXTG-site transpeptidase (sortase) family protein
MYELKPSRGRFSLALLALSLGALVLGIGLVSWALVNIGAESVASEAYSDLPLSPTTVAGNQAGSEGDPADQLPTAPNRNSSSSSTTSALSQVKPTGDPVDQLPAVPTRSFSSSSTSPAVSQVKPTGDRVAPFPRAGDTIGSLSIPALKQKWPIIQGTGANELKRGVGHFIQSVMPGEADNCVLSGHRTTVFAKLGKLKIDDRLIVQTSAGTFTYEIARIRIVHKDDLTVIVPTDHAELTLTTCYPFVYVGGAPDRYIVSADLVARQ